MLVIKIGKAILFSCLDVKWFSYALRTSANHFKSIFFNQLLQALEKPIYKQRFKQQWKTMCMSRSIHEN